MSKKQPEQLEGPGKHSGRQHPVAEKVRDVKHDPSAQKSAHAARKAATGDSKYGNK